MYQRSGPTIRDRADRLIRGATVGGIGGALALAGVFSTMAAMYFSGKPVVAENSSPAVPVAKAPVQAPRKVIVHVVHRAASGGSTYAPVPSGPGQAPGPAPLPPPAPVCHSTPSHPC